MWFYFIVLGLTLIIIVISYFVWKENYNKEYSDYDFEGQNTMNKKEDMVNMVDKI